MTNNTFKPADESPPARRIDGLDAALVGIARQSGVNVAVYDYGGCLTLLRLQGISEEAAPEHLARKLENDQGRAGAPVILYWPSRQAPQAPLPADRVLKLIPAADIAILTQALEMISGVAGRLDFRQQGLEFQQANMPTERGPTTIAHSRRWCGRSTWHGSRHLSACQIRSDIPSTTRWWWAAHDPTYAIAFIIQIGGTYLYDK